MISRKQFDAYVEAADVFLQALLKSYRHPKLNKHLRAEIAIATDKQLSDDDWEYIMTTLAKKALRSGMFVRYKSMCHANVKFHFTGPKGFTPDRKVAIRIAMYAMKLCNDRALPAHVVLAKPHSSLIDYDLRKMLNL